MTANLIATFGSREQAQAAVDALLEQNFDRSGVWMTTEPVPTIEVRGSKRALELADTVLRACSPLTLAEGTETEPQEGFAVESSAHTNQPKTANDQWRRHRANMADDPQNWAESRKQVKYGNARAGEDGFSGQVGEPLGNSMRDRHVAVRDDQGARTLTGNGKAGGGKPGSEK